MGDDLLYWVALNMIPEVGPARIGILLERFGMDPAAVFRAAPEALSAAGLTARGTRALREFKPGEAEREIELAGRAGIDIVTRPDPRYPELLAHIPDPPPVLFTRGKLKTRDSRAVGIVGTRLCSPYGLVQATRFAGELAAAGFTVVSGLARGIDSAAHRGALMAKGRTIAVLGSGLLEMYPPENRRLAGEIATSGALISEFPLRTRPSRTTFPRRNRIVSGLSRALLVVEAAERSGALITAGLALEQNREVFALPGPVDRETSSGPNQLLREGAQPATAPEDIVEALAPVLPFPETAEKREKERDRAETREAATATAGGNEPGAQLLLERLGQGGAVTIPEAADLLGEPVALAGGLLSRLELAGLVEQGAGGRFRRAKPGK